MGTLATLEMWKWRTYRFWLSLDFSIMGMGNKTKVILVRMFKRPVVTNWA